jgi:hypothetical protein
MASPQILDLLDKIFALAYLASPYSGEGKNGLKT